MSFATDLQINPKIKSIGSKVTKANNDLTKKVTEVSLEQQFIASSSSQVDLEFDANINTLWLTMLAETRPCFTPELLHELAEAQYTMKRLNQAYSSGAQMPVKYKVIGSDCDGVFNLGGDLNLFQQLIASANKAQLTAYATACIDVIHRNAIASNQPVITIAMLQGDALGGGFETALSCDVIIAEKQVKMGLPEILFNLFPGMGAYSFLSRKLGGKLAEKIISSGILYSAQELFDMGLVDVLANEGEGRSTTHAYIKNHHRKHNAYSAIFQAGKQVQPVSYEELKSVVDIWVEAALRLSPQDLRKMQRLVSAQDKFAPQPAQALRR